MQLNRSEIQRQLLSPVDGAGLALFRVGFGLILAFQALEFLRLDFVQNDLIAPVLHYPFPAFSFLPILPAEILTGLLVLMLLAGLSIAIGRWVRPALAFFGFFYTYLWLLDRGYYNNHYYLISLLCGMLLLLRSDSWQPLRRRQVPEMIPAWQPVSIKLMLLIVFVWAGLNKLQSGWLVNHQPMTAILQAKAGVTGNPAWSSPGWAALLSWSGMLFDLSIIPLLWWRRTRLFAFFGMIAFNVFNFWLFHDVGEIGVFPWLVLVSCAIFVDPAKVRTTAERLRSRQKKGKAKRKPASGSIPVFSVNWPMKLMWGFLVFQALWPARHLLIPGHVDWTSEGQRFAWRMKIMYKDFQMRFFTVENGGKGNRYETTLTRMLTPKQYTALGYYPDLIPPTAAFLKAQALKQGLQNPIVVVEYQSGLNGGPRQYLLDPALDASALRWSPFWGNDWIIPYKGE